MGPTAEPLKITRLALSPYQRQVVTCALVALDDEIALETKEMTLGDLALGELVKADVAIKTILARLARD
jgi:hypothetical protein